MFDVSFSITMFLYFFIIPQKIGGIGLSKVRKINLDEQFQLIQKPTIKVIQTEYGDIYDCVDFYQQPAFDHPLLKNHTFHPEMRPTFLLNEDLTHSDINAKIAKIALKDGGCPTGTVPIRRVNKDELYKINQFTKNYARSNVQRTPGTHFAMIQTNSSPSMTSYSGVGGTFNTYNMSLEKTQYSSGEFLIQNGDERIKVGWTINPTIYKDDLVRLFGYFDGKDAHCFDMLCPGFVSVQKDIALGTPIIPGSVRGQMPYVSKLRVHQDIVNGNWWLNVEGKDIGFWPKQIFTSMSNTATFIAVGGEAYGPLDRPLTPMGNGYYPVQSMRLNSFFCRLFLVDGNHKIVRHPETKIYTDDQHYGVIDAGDTLFGRLIFYGGTIVD